MSAERLIGMLIFPRLTQLDMTGPYEVIELDCSHWIVQEALDQVAGPIAAHFKKYS